MLQFNTKCLQCESSSNLNTRMSVNVDNVTYEVVLCDEHADDTTPKKAREIVTGKLKEYNELVEKMKGFGIDLSQTSAGGIIVAEKPQPPAPPPTPEPAPTAQTTPTGQQGKIIIASQKQQPQQSQQPKPQTEMKVAYSTKQPGQTAARSEQFKIRPIGGTASGQAGQVQLESRGSVNVGDTIQRVIEEGKKSGRMDADAKYTVPVSRVAETQTVRGRGGQPMVIPRVIKHANQGTTVINVIDTGGDQTIQQRFKSLAAQSRDNNNTRPFNYGQGYDVMNCTLCGGTGITASNGQNCPKCDGTGILNKGWNG